MSVVRVALAIACAAVALTLIPAVSRSHGAVHTEKRRPPAPDFRLQTLSGSHWSLSEHRDQVVVVNFWATWCPPCRREMPALVRLHERFAARGVAFAGISLDEHVRDLPRFLEQYHVSYPVLLPGSRSPLTSTIEGLPTTWLIDRGGRIAHTYAGVITEPGLSEVIEALLAEPSSRR